MAPHHSKKLKQFMASGHPAVAKHAATWSEHDDQAVRHPAPSVQSGSGEEHHLPQPYSQVGGVTVVAVHTGADDVVLDMGFDVGLVVDKRLLDTTLLDTLVVKVALYVGKDEDVTLHDDELGTLGN